MHAIAFCLSLGLVCGGLPGFVVGIKYLIEFGNHPFINSYLAVYGIAASIVIGTLATGGPH